MISVYEFSLLRLIYFHFFIISLVPSWHKPLTFQHLYLSPLVSPGHISLFVYLFSLSSTSYADLPQVSCGLLRGMLFHFSGSSCTHFELRYKINLVPLSIQPSHSRVYLLYPRAIFCEFGQWQVSFLYIMLLLSFLVPDQIFRTHLLLFPHPPFRSTLPPSMWEIWDED